LQNRHHDFLRLHRGYGCYGLEAQMAPSADSETFLEDVKRLDYTISSDPEDPIFYSTCLVTLTSF